LLDTVQRDSESLANLRCDEQDLPEYLNIARYLGTNAEDTVKSFHYLEDFRIDTLKNHAVHRVGFRISQPYMLRVVGLVHTHIEFDLELKQVINNQPRSIIKSTAKNFEDSLFAQLESGSYFIKLTFFADAKLIQMPCQKIRLEWAMAPLRGLDLVMQQVLRGGPQAKEQFNFK